MRHLGLPVIFLVMSASLVCCQNSMQTIEKQEAKVALMHEKEKSILAECEMKRIRGEIKTYVQSTQCSNPVIIRAHEDAGDPAMNLVYLITAYRLAVAERIDKGVLSRTEGNLMLSQLMSRINTERLQKDIGAPRDKQQPIESYDALLQGIGVWKGSVNPPVREDTVEPPRSPESAVPDQQQTRDSQITCSQNGNLITCQ